MTGINRNVKLDYFNDQEKEIVKILSNFFEVTSSRSVNIANSKYAAILLKPSEDYQHSFNLNFEIIAVFSRYTTFQVRSNDAIDAVRSSIQNSYEQEFRIEEVCTIMISNDSNIENIIKDILTNNKDNQRIIIPFSYEDLIYNANDGFIKNRFRNHFYKRDLFAFEDALKKDLYFFGRERKNLALELVNKHLSGECSGIFGLRKTGKTSILYRAQRLLEQQKGTSIFIDCQVLHLKRWNNLLFYIITELARANNVKIKSTEKDYEIEEKVIDVFERDIIKIFQNNGRKKVLITFGVSLSEHWKIGKDFPLFWQHLRSVFQKTQGKYYSYLIASTNPLSVEHTYVHDTPNPIYDQIKPVYISQFDVQDTKDMVNKIGGFMGLTFDDNVINNLVTDFGGHPFWIRQVCSEIDKEVSSLGLKRPIEVTRIVYEKAKPNFERKYAQKNAAQILEVLIKFFPYEYEMLEALAKQDIETFEEFANTMPTIIDHLIGYGIIYQQGGMYDFKIDIVKKHLSDKNKYNKLIRSMSNEERLQELLNRRDKIERKLRKIVRDTLRVVLGEQEAKKEVLKLHAQTKGKERYNLNLPYKIYLILIFIIFILTILGR
jgi:hypothetical protein